MPKGPERSRLALLAGIAVALATLGQNCFSVNQPPIVVVGQDQTINPGDVAQLDGSGSSDPNGDNLTFTWKQTGGDAVELHDALTAVAGFTAPARTADAVYSFQLTISDGTHSVDSPGVTITVRAAPPPTVDAGPDQSVDEGDPVTLSGTATGLNVTLVWEVPPESGVVLSSVTDPQAVITAPAVSEDTPVVLTLKATDSGGRTATDTVTITFRTLFTTGVLIPDPAELALLPQALNPSIGANLPPSINLTASLPPVGNQGSLGSCTAWATGYAGSTYSYKLATGADISSPAHQASPMYVYYQTLQVQASQCGSGTDMRKASDVLVRTGTPSLEILPYREQCLLSNPGSAGADRFRIGTYKLLSNDRNSIRTELAAGRIVVFGAKLYNDFFKPPTSGGVYHGNGVLMRQGQQHAAHAMTIAGYDDAQGAFLIMNSWGTGWGNGGYLWWAYDSIEKLMFVALSYTPRNGTGPNGGGGGGGGPITCSTGYQPALNNPSICCDPAHPYYRSDGYCWSTPDPGNCKSGYAVCLNNAKLCCPEGCLYDNGDGYCRKDPPDGCQSGYSPARNYPSVCCGDNFPWYNADKDWCQTTDPSTGCKPGYILAFNNSSVCCPDAYPYHYSDKKCYPVLCPSGSSPSLTNLSICCPNDFRYYLSDGRCHKCQAGFSPAVNNGSICCPDGYPYYGSDGLCHTNPTAKSLVNGDDAVPPGADGTGEEESVPDSSDPLAPDGGDAPGGPAGVPPPSDEDFASPGGGQIWNASAYQWLARAADGSISVKLVFEGMLASPIDVKRVTLTDPNRVQISQDYHAAFGNGYVYFERFDGRQWLAGEYRLEIAGHAGGENEVIYSAQVQVPPLPDGQSLTTARTIGSAVAPQHIPVGDEPMAVAGDNGQPAAINAP